MQIIEVDGKKYELASLWERWLGQFLDGLIYFAIIIIPVVLLSLVGREELYIVVIIAFVIAIFYLLFQDGLKNGQSYGKRLVKTKVIDSRSGAPCRFWQSFVRNLLLSIPILGFIDLIFILGAKSQRLGDKAASTLVVKVTEVSSEMP